jgi:hypothetical protein
MKKDEISVEQAFEVVKKYMIDQITKNSEKDSVFQAIGLSKEWEDRLKTNQAERFISAAMEVDKYSESIGVCFNEASSIEEAIAHILIYKDFMYTMANKSGEFMKKLMSL